MPPFDPGLGFVDDKIRFVWQTDSHVLSTFSDGRKLAVEAAAADTQLWKPNAYIHTGDIGDNLVQNIRNGFSAIRQTGRPIYWTIGNHDEEEITLGPGQPNTTAIEHKHIFNKNAPFYYSTIMTSGDGSLRALCLFLDCNFYDDDPFGVSPGDSPNHQPGDRIGSRPDGPGGGYYRMFTDAQLGWARDALDADDKSDIVLVFAHYPPDGVTCTDYKNLADILQEDGRPMIGFCGHVHPNATVYTISSTDTQAVFPFYKCPATQESGCWTRVTLGFNGSDITIDGMEIHNFTNPGDWTINEPFSLAVL